MAKSKGRDLSPSEDIASESLNQMNIQRKRMSDRDFRDAVTRAKGAVTGVKTQTAQWDRWSV
jgi:hypothetical protein